MDLFLGPYLKVVGGGLGRVVLMVFDFEFPPDKSQDTRTSVLGDINPERPAAADLPPSP